MVLFRDHRVPRVVRGVLGEEFAGEDGLSVPKSEAPVAAGVLGRRSRPLALMSFLGWGRWCGWAPSPCLSQAIPHLQRPRAI